MRACANRTDADRENENALACLMTSLTDAGARSVHHSTHIHRNLVYNKGDNMSAHTNAKTEPQPRGGEGDGGCSRRRGAADVC